MVDELNAQIAALNDEITELKAENKKLGSKPSVQPVKMHTDKQNGWELLRELNANRPR